MSDLIDRHTAIDALSEGALVNYQATGHNNGLVKAIDVIKGLPSAQPEIIRCKDCDLRYTSCPMVVRIGNILEFFTQDNDFCSRAQRRREEVEHKWL